MSSLIQSAVATSGYVRLKFSSTIDVSTLVNDNFTLANADATPSIVSDPFETISLSRDYDSISRILNLYFAQTLVPNSDYVLTAKDLATPAGDLLPTETVQFTTTDVVLPSPSELVPESAPVVIEDQSIRDVGSIVSIEDVILDGGSGFYIVAINPGLDIHHFLAEDYNEGKIEIEFNIVPAANFVSSDYFKVQRKAIGQGISRWQDVSAIIASDPSTNRVIILLPSTDGTPVYAEPNHVYWENGYKYRVRISSAIGI